MTTVLLPTRRGAPLPSPEMPADTRERPDPGGTTAGLWQVATTALSAATLYAVLRTPLPQEAVAGAGWRHLGDLAAFAEDLAGRGRVLPTVVPAPAPDPGRVPPGTATASPERARARWAAVLTGTDAAWARSLALAAPAALAAAIPADGSVTAPRDAVTATLDLMVDAAVRRRLDDQFQGVALRRGVPLTC